MCVCTQAALRTASSVAAKTCPCTFTTASQLQVRTCTPLLFSTMNVHRLLEDLWMICRY